ncbi:MAG: hypothetical protein AB2L24_22820 [Mangrovibacterium sp.]
MLDFNVLCEIGKEAKKNIKTDSGGNPIEGQFKHFLFYLFFTVVPLAAASTPWYWCVKLSDMESYIGTGIAIFTGLFFSLLLNISAKIRIEKENINIDVENFQAFKENMRQISSITQYVVILGILIMLLVLLNSLINLAQVYIEKIFTSIALFLLLRYFICLLYMLQRFYFVLRDEIKNIL